MFTSDILLKGKHASYADFLSKSTEQNDKSKKVAGVLDTIYDVYAMGAVIGLYLGLKAPEDKESNDTKRIFAEKVIKEQLNLEFIYRLVMLVDNSVATNEEKIGRAFKEDDNKNNMELFNSYVRGGIEWLYEQFTSTANTKDEYLEKIYEIVDEFNQEIDSK